MTDLEKAYRLAAAEAVAEVRRMLRMYEPAIAPDELSYELGGELGRVMSTMLSLGDGAGSPADVRTAALLAAATALRVAAQMTLQEHINAGAADADALDWAYLGEAS